MKNVLLILSLLLLASCTTTQSTVPVSNLLGERRFIYGTRTQDSNVTEPSPQTSEYFKVLHAGFVIVDKGAAYYLKASVLKNPPKPYYIQVEYENPLDASAPFINDMVLDEDMKGAMFSSDDVIQGIENYKTYTITVRVYRNRNDAKPIDSFVQKVRSYVDTTGESVRMFKNIRPAQ